MNQKTSIIILTYNNLEYTKDCIESIRKYTEKNTYEIIIVDNKSTDGTRNWLRQQKDMKIIFNEENVGFPKGSNIGIEHAENGNDILLLNNDTITTKNWLKNLQICLHSDPKIGAVGAISNNNANLQGCDFSYQDFKKMQELAEQNNQSEPSRWEEKVCLIGYCMLIKREVIEKLHGLDEGFSPGYVEDNDLSLQIIQLGYRIILCHDSFIHHYLGTAFRKDQEKFNRLVLKNRDYFEKKWHFSCFAFDVTKESSIFLAQNPQDILDYHCGIGASSLRIKHYYKNANIIGLEPDKNKAIIAKNFIPVVEKIDELAAQSFDTIYIGNLLEEVERPLCLIHDLKPLLKKDGVVIGEIHNIATIQNILLLLQNQWYYTNFQKQNHFTHEDLERMFQEQGYHDGYIFSFKKELSDAEKELLGKLQKEEDNVLATTYYSFRFKI